MREKAKKIYAELRSNRKERYRLDARILRDQARLAKLDDRRNKLLDKLGYVPAGL